ncbi:MAG: acetate kinase, partial [Oscillospiraceae bacterium]
MNILVINAGSSSLKYQLLDSGTHHALAVGLCERIGIDGHLKHKPANGKPVFDQDVAMPTHAEAIQAVLDMLVSKEYGVIESPKEIGAVGHRVVHGGEAFASSVIIDEAVMQALTDCIPLAPLHNPANITGIRACQALMPKTPMVAVFDTAFHQTIPPKAFLYALPYEYYVENQVRRYGFHGTSHKYVSQRAANMMGKPLGSLKLISCHLGNGSSVTAIKYGKSVETSMGFTPLDGLPMGTRCGAIDPSIVEYIMKARNMTIDEVNDAMNKKSGVLGISGVSSDFRDLDVAAAQGNERAKLAIDLFAYKVTKRIGSAAAAMGGVDAVIFTAGVGENGAAMRAEICAELGFLGIKLDEEKNNVHGKEMDISAPDATVKTLVIPTNEELMIAI